MAANLLEPSDFVDPLLEELKHACGVWPLHVDKSRDRAGFQLGRHHYLRIDENMLKRVGLEAIRVIYMYRLQVEWMKAKPETEELSRAERQINFIVDEALLNWSF